MAKTKKIIKETIGKGKTLLKKKTAKITKIRLNIRRITAHAFFLGRLYFSII